MLEQIVGILSDISNSFDEKADDILNENKQTIIQLQKDQLNAGLKPDGTEFESYLSDPYFKTRNAAVAYMNMKTLYKKPQFFGLFPDKGTDIPNLAVTGVLFHAYIDSVAVKTEVQIDANGSPIIGSLNQKYGSVLGLHPYSEEYLISNFIDDSMLSWVNSKL